MTEEEQALWNEAKASSETSQAAVVCAGCGHSESAHLFNAAKEYPAEGWVYLSRMRMRYHRAIRALTLITTFGVGVALTSIISSHHQPLTFSCDGITTAFRTHYHSSDGQALRYGCSEHGSATEAENEIHEEVAMQYRQSAEGQLTKVSIVEQTTIQDANGRKTGVRFVLDNAEILWTEGSRLREISGPSVHHALLFERSRAWHWESCWDLSKVKDTSKLPTAAEHALGADSP